MLDAGCWMRVEIRLGHWGRRGMSAHLHVCIERCEEVGVQELQAPRYCLPHCLVGSLLRLISQVCCGLRDEDLVADLLKDLLQHLSGFVDIGTDRFTLLGAGLLLWTAAGTCSCVWPVLCLMPPSTGYCLDGSYP
jgi:hypothetical protein